MSQTTQSMTLLQRFLEKDGWNAQQQRDGIFNTSFRGRNGVWPLQVGLIDGEAPLIVHSVCPVEAPDARAGQVLEFITRANCGMRVGNFEYDLDQGVVSYKTTADTSDDALTEGQIHAALYANVSVMDKYISPLIDVIKGGDLQKALTKAEG